VAGLSLQRAREAAAALTAIPGVSLYAEAPYAHEFSLQLPKSSSALVRALCKENIIAGLPLGRRHPSLDRVLLVACTEKNTPAQISLLAESVARVLPTI
jgi:glycine dehydrogenase subunit 1